jgi:hypothetical protein
MFGSFGDAFGNNLAGGIFSGLGNSFTGLGNTVTDIGGDIFGGAANNVPTIDSPVATPGIAPQGGGIFGNVGQTLFGNQGALMPLLGTYATFQQMNQQKDMNKMAREMMEWQKQQYLDKIGRERAYMAGQLGDRAINRSHAYEDGQLVKSKSAFANETPEQAAKRYGVA